MNRIEELIGGSIPQAVAGLIRLETAARRLRMELASTGNGTAFLNLLSAVGCAFDVQVEDLLGRSRRQPLALARQMAMTLVRKLWKYPLEDVGEMFHRDHGTVLHAVRVTQDVCATYPKYRSVYEDLVNVLSRPGEASLQTAPDIHLPQRKLAA